MEASSKLHNKERLAFKEQLDRERLEMEAKQDSLGQEVSEM
jgi:hypothetical protein